MSIRSATAVATGLIGLALVLALWDRDAVEPEPVTVARSGETSVRRDPVRTAVRDGESSHATTASPDREGSRQPVRSAAISGRVIDEAGAPVRSAVVCWVPIPARLAEPSVRRADIALEVRSTSIEMSADEEGSFVFAEVPTLADGLVSMLWISSPRHECIAVLLDESRDSWPKGAEWRLASAAPVRVRVVGASGDRIAGATVVQEGLELRDPENDLPARAGWLFRREVATGADGTIDVTPIPGRHRLVARLGDLESPPWDGEPSSLTELTLGASFRAGGFLTWSPDLSESTAVYVTCEAVVGLHSVELSRNRVRAGTWGPLPFSLTGAPEYRFRLDGDGVVPQLHLVSAPRAGSQLSLDFDVEPGHTVWFRVVDEDGETVPEAEAIVGWSHRGVEVSRSARVREDGFIAVWGCPDGTMRTSFRAPGFVQAETESIELPLPEEGFLPVTLVRAGILRGVVVDSAGPVHDFEVVVWSQFLENGARSYPFTNALDGRFVLDQVPFGNLTVIATAVGHSQSRPRNEVVRAGQEVDVWLELGSAVVAVGRVVAAGSGDPVADATIRIRASDGYEAIGSAGPPYAVDADGVFSVVGVASGLAFVDVSAPGFSSRGVSVTVSDGGAAEFGVIELHRRQALEVVLRCDESVDTGAFRLQVDGPDGIANRAFDLDGFARLDGLSSGEYTVSVEYPDGTWRRIEERFVPGDVWRVEFFASAGATLRVEVVVDDGALPGKEAWVSVKSATPRGWAYCADALDAAGRAVFHNVPPGDHQVSVHSHPDRGSRQLASTRVTLVHDDDVVVRLRVGDAERRVRVVDELGHPLQGVSVGVNLPGDELGWSATELTDAAGACVIPGLTVDDVFVHLAHPDRGYGLGLPVRLAHRSEVTEIVFESPVTTELILMRRTGPVVGAGGRFYDSLYMRSVAGPLSDELGRSVWTNLAPGDYVFVFGEEGYWPIHTPVAVAEGSAPLQVDLYRLCDLRIEVTRDGAPVPSVEVVMQRLGGSIPLRDFVVSGQVGSNTGSMVTGENGVLFLERVAEARYGWSVSPEGGPPLEGEIEIEPDRQAVLRITL